MTSQEKLNRNVDRTLLVGFFQVFLVIIPVAVPFFQSKGLSMQEVFSLQALFGAVVLLTEVPSGYLADLFGRRNTLVIGAVIGAIGHSCLLAAEGFWTLAIFEVCLGISHSLISGADLALLYDTELALGKSEDEQRQVVGRLYGTRTFSEALAGIACSVVFLYAGFEELVWLQVIVGWIPVLLVLRLVEPPGQSLATGDHAGNFGLILRHLAGHSPVLRLVFLALAVWSLTTFYAVWLLQEVWQRQGIDLGAAHDKGARIALPRGLQGRLPAGDDLTARCLEVGIARDDDGVPPRQRAADRRVAHPAHDHHVAHGHTFEVLEVLRLAPGQGPILADDTTLGPGDDQSEMA